MEENLTDGIFFRLVNLSLYIQKTGKTDFFLYEINKILGINKTNFNTSFKIRNLLKNCDVISESRIIGKIVNIKFKVNKLDSLIQNSSLYLRMKEYIITKKPFSVIP